MTGAIKNILDKANVTSQVGITNNTYPVTGSPFTANTAFSQNLNASTNFVFKTPPSINLNDVENPNDYKITTTDTKNASGDIITRNFSIVYTPGLKIPENDIIVFIAESVEDYTRSENNIYNYEVNESPLNPLGEDREIKIYGDVNAEFKLSLFNKTDGYENLDINSNPTFKIPASGVYVCVFECPGLKYWTAPGNALYDQTIEITIASHGGSVLKFTNTTTYLYQYVDRSLFFNISKGADNIWQDSTGAAISSNESIWNRTNGQTAGWSTVAGISLTNSGADGVKIQNNNSSNFRYINTDLKLMIANPAPSDFIAGRTYEITFKAKTTSNGGRIDFLILDSTSKVLATTVSRGDTTSYRDVRVQFIATTANAKFVVGNLNENYSGGMIPGQILYVKDFRFYQLETSMGIKIKRAAGTEDNFSYAFSYDVYAHVVNKKIGYNNLAAASNLRATFANIQSEGAVGGDNPINTGTKIENIRPSNFSSWRRDETIPLFGVLEANNFTKMNYEPECIATVGGLVVDFFYGSAATKAKMTISGNLQLIKQPLGRDTKIEFTIPSWFKISTTAF